MGGNRLLNEKLDYNREELAENVTANLALFNDAQRRVYDAVMGSVDGNPKLFFLHSAGGCGKPLYVTLLLLLSELKEKLSFVFHPLE